MILKYRKGNPIPTESTVLNINISENIEFFNKHLSNNNMLINIDENTYVYGLGGSNRGINKVGYKYTSYCSDDPVHTEDKVSLYAAHNFFVLKNEKEVYGIFIDSPAKITYDIGFTDINEFRISIETDSYDIYYISGNSIIEIVREYRKLVGKSYLAPKWAFGYGQSRWGYMNESDIENVLKGHNENGIPLDMIYLDIDYMKDFKDFTINEERFPNFSQFVSKMKKEEIHLIPIIDAGVKIEKDYDVYEQGIENNYFCFDKENKPFVAAVWPGQVHFPDFLNKDARAWFGNKYKFLMDKGIDGFWNDMNEPAIFYTRAGIDNMFKTVDKYRNKENIGVYELWEMKDSFMAMNNSDKDYSSFYHNYNGQILNHKDVHNLYGYNMTRAAGEQINLISPDKRVLLFSRSSFIGMHRYGGIWTGDNFSWWSHILLSLQMMPGLNMSGFMYIGSDIGGFSGNTSEDLMMRWLQFAIFTPLMRNHSAIGTKDQELYRFKNIDKLRNIVEVRYRLLPYLYSEYMKSILNDDMYFKPLSFVYPEDEMAYNIEDQLIIGDEIMIAPVYKANSKGRFVYIPETMKAIKFTSSATYEEKIYEKGNYFIDLNLHEFVIFIRQNRAIPFSNIAKRVENVDFNNFEFLSFGKSTYEYYNDNGLDKEISEKNIVKYEI